MPKLNLLFMCVANSARSQLAEGLARAVFPEAQIESAGSKPGKLNPFAVQVMQEIGLDISAHFSKSVDDLSPTFLQKLDFVITLCAEEVCPVLLTRAPKLHWPHPDPAPPAGISEAPSETLAKFRAARDAIQQRLEAFRRELDRSPR